MSAPFPIHRATAPHRTALTLRPETTRQRGLSGRRSDQTAAGGPARPRTEYSITAKGRRALSDWLDTEGTHTRIESEQLLKLFFADQGTTEQAKATIASLQSWAEARSAENVAVAHSYLGGVGPFPERAAVLAITGRFLTDFADMVHEWATWASAVVDTWPDDPKQARPDWATFEAIATRPLPFNSATRE